MVPSRADIEAAAARIGPHVRTTPVLAVEAGALGLPAGTGPVLLKLELLQVTGSFKPRGAFNRLLTGGVPKGGVPNGGVPRGGVPRGGVPKGGVPKGGVPEGGPPGGGLPGAGVVAASGGNHGAAVAHAARALGVPAEIFVPELTGAAKRARIEQYGARLVVGGATYDEARVASEARAAATGALVVHAYDQPAVLAGQGTLAREFDASAPGLTHVLVATGGGGLLGGMAAWYRGTGCRLVSVEPEACPAMAAALAAGEPVPAAVGGVAADSLGARQVGALGFAAARAAGVDAVLVPDAAIAAAQRALWEVCRLVAEPGGATALAALLSGAWRAPAGARVGVVVCGGNVTGWPG